MTAHERKEGRQGAEQHKLPTLLAVRKAGLRGWGERDRSGAACEPRRVHVTWLGCGWRVV